MKTHIHPPTEAGITAAARLLQDGQLVAFATETVYGLGADARNSAAVANIFAAKNRPRFNPLIVHVPDLAGAAELVEIPPQARALAEAFWPGPLTMVLPRCADAGLSDLVTAGLDTLAVRIPANPLARRLLAAAGVPVAAPSANPSGKISPTSAAHVEQGLGGRIAAILDGGRCDVWVESTILGFDGDTPVLLRAGGLAIETIEPLLPRPLSLPQAGRITAPGQMKSHYAPDAKMRLNVTEPTAGEVLLGFGARNGALNLSPAGDLREAAVNLFSYMRKIDDLATRSGKSIAVAPIPETGLGLAINDRLNRAAAPR